MWKLFFLSFVVWQQLAKSTGQINAPDTTPPSLSSIILNTKKYGDEALPANFQGGQYNFHAANIIFSTCGRPLPKFSMDLANDWENIRNKTHRADYRVVAGGLSAMKVHSRHLSWNKARRICVEEGGHLAVIRSNVEEAAVIQMMIENVVDQAWLGVHDKFEEGDWVTVTDEPLASVGWAKWTTKFGPQYGPDNWNGIQHCANFYRDPAGMDDDNCELGKPFVCQISDI